MTEYEVTYFNARGRAEIIRWLLAYNGISFKDVRIEEEDWPTKKSTIPGGKLPLLRIDGEVYTQSLAISRYFAKEAGIMPEDNLQAYYCDVLGDTFYEMMTEVYKVIMSSNSKEEIKRRHKEEVYPNAILPVLTRFQKKLSENRDKKWLLSDQVSWADLLVGVFIGEVYNLNEEFLEPFPEIVTFIKKVRDIPKIKEWLEKAPDTEY